MGDWSVAVGIYEGRNVPAGQAMNNARRVGVGPRHPIVRWVYHHRQAAADSLQKLVFEPISTLLTWMVLGIALALPATLLVLLSNVLALADTIDLPARFSLFLNELTTLEQASDIARRMEQRVDIAQVSVLDRGTALADFGVQTGLESLIESLDANPLPHTLLVEPAAHINASRMDELGDALTNTPGVANVVFDTQWLARLETSLLLFERLVIGLGLMMAIGAILILGNTLRLAIEARRAEIVVVKLIGGGDAFVRRPFLYTGLWCGIGGGVLAIVLVIIFLSLLASPATTLLALYNSEWRFQGLSFIGALQLALGGGSLGLLSAWQATTIHLRRVEPK